MTVPNFLIVGAAKAGTTALYRYLRQHPDVFMPSTIKETFFLSELNAETFTGNAAIYANDAIESLEGYQSLFRKAGNSTAVGEACVAYLFFYQKTIPNIEHYLGKDCKIIILLRNPVERAYSNYLHHVRDGFETHSFEEAISLEKTRRENNAWWGFQYREVGLYAAQVSAYLENFGRQNVKIIQSSLLSSIPELVLQDIFSYLGVNRNFIVDTKTRYNVSGIPDKSFIQHIFREKNMLRSTARLLVPEHFRRRIARSSFITNLKNRNLDKPEMGSNTRRELENYYFDDIKALETITGMDLSSWIKPST